MLREALEAAKLTRCAVHEDAKSAMKSYLDTWVVSRLDEVIEAVEATANARRS
jgi:hypothetical protein